MEPGYVRFCDGLNGSLRLRETSKLAGRFLLEQWLTASPLFHNVSGRICKQMKVYISNTCMTSRGWDRSSDKGSASAPKAWCHRLTLPSTNIYNSSRKKSHTKKEGSLFIKLEIFGSGRKSSSIILTRWTCWSRSRCCQNCVLSPKNCELPSALPEESSPLPTWLS